MRDNMRAQIPNDLLHLNSVTLSYLEVVVSFCNTIHYLICRGDILHILFRYTITGQQPYLLHLLSYRYSCYTLVYN